MLKYYISSCNPLGVLNVIIISIFIDIYNYSTDITGILSIKFIDLQLYPFW
jgi:hypothetical protein